MRKTLLILAIIVIVIIVGFLAWWQFIREVPKPITNFEECAAAGNPVMESYPRQCRTKDGRNFVEILPSPSPLDSGVSGIVLLGPTCPVIQESLPAGRQVPDLNCADKPYKTTVQVIAIGSPQSSPFAVVESDYQGQYRVMLPPGEYGLQPVGGNPLPRCETKNVTIEPNVIKEVNLSCDTGIR